MPPIMPISVAGLDTVDVFEIGKRRQDSTIELGYLVPLGDASWPIGMRERAASKRDHVGTMLGKRFHRARRIMQGAVCQ